MVCIKSSALYNNLQSYILYTKHTQCCRKITTLVFRETTSRERTTSESNLESSILSYCIHRQSKFITLSHDEPSLMSINSKFACQLSSFTTLIRLICWIFIIVWVHIKTQSAWSLGLASIFFLFQDRTLVLPFVAHLSS